MPKAKSEGQLSTRRDAEHRGTFSGQHHTKPPLRPSANSGILFTAGFATSGEAAIWLHKWKYLICFPAPVVASVITYSFGVGVQVVLWGGQGSATFLSFIALGETANFTGQEIMVNNDGDPLVANLGAV
jgi:hypothetical protein